MPLAGGAPCAGLFWFSPCMRFMRPMMSVGPAGANVLVLGLTATSAGQAREREIQTIVRSLPADVELWVGGRRATRHAALISPRGLVLPDYQAYQQELVRLGGRTA